jgi:glycosyltransferase involved in cell wall biosynthesis
MAEQPRASVITIFLNAERFLGEAIESVLAQTCHNWELLLVDDGSSDASTLIAREYVARFPGRIRYLEHAGHQNRGKSASRNLGIRNARGEYVTFLDADDVFLPEKLERQIAILDRHPAAAMTYGPSLYWYGWTGNAEDIGLDRLGELGVTTNRLVEPPQLMTLYLANGGCVPCTCAWMVRKECVEPTGGSEDSFTNLYDDQVFLAKIVLNYQVHVDGGSWDKYRQHPDMSSNRAIQSGEYSLSGPHSSQKIYYTWLSMYVSARKIVDANLNAALKRAMFAYEHPVWWSVTQKGRNVRRRVQRVGELLSAHASHATLSIAPSSSRDVQLSTWNRGRSNTSK